MTTVHANNPRDALRRIENMVSMAGLNYPIHVIRDQIASALDVVIHLDRLTGGGRKVVSVAEVTGMEGETVCLQEIFRFNQLGIDENGNAEGEFEACGARPQLLAKLEREGVKLPHQMFQKHVLSQELVTPDGSTHVA